MIKWIKSIIITMLFMSILIFVIYYYDNTPTPQVTISTQKELYTYDQNSSNQIDLQPMTYVSIDINPSIEIILNKNQRVISYQSFTIEGDILFNNINLFDKTFEYALLSIIEQFNAFDFINNRTEIYFTINNEFDTTDKLEAEIQSINTNILEAMKPIIYDSLEGLIAIEHITIWEIDTSLRKLAQSQKISPGKLVLQMKSLEELQEMEQHLIDNYKSIIEAKDKTFPMPNNIQKQDKQTMEVLKPITPVGPTSPSVQEIPEITKIPSVGNQ